MTIVAGFPNLTFVALAADSEEGGGELAKSSVRKIAQIDKGDVKCLIGGAGNGDFIDLAVQHADEQFTSKLDRKAVGKKLEAIVTDIYANRIDKYPEHERDALWFELLCAVWVRRDTFPQLLRVRRSACLPRASPEVIGSGTYLARYLIATLGRPSMDPYQTIRLAAYVIGQAKRFVKGCGDQTQIMSIGADGTISEMPPVVVNQNDLSTSLFVEDLARVIFFATDPMTTQFDGDKIRKAIEAGIAEWASQLPTRLLERTGIPAQFLMQAAEQASEAARAAQSNPQLPMPDLTDPLPLPESPAKSHES